MEDELVMMDDELCPMCITVPVILGTMGAGWLGLRCPACGWTWVAYDYEQSDAFETDTGTEED